jgi:hypothetical protein
MSFLPAGFMGSKVVNKSCDSLGVAPCDFKFERNRAAARVTLTHGKEVLCL